MRNIFSILLLPAAAIAAAAPLPDWLKVGKNGTFRIEEHTFRPVNFDPSFAHGKLQESKLEKQADAAPKVEALHFDGTVRGEVKSAFADGILSFTADPGCFPGGVMIYWITRGAAEKR